MFANFDVTPRFLFTVLLACNTLQPSKTQGCPFSPCQYGGTCVNNVCSCPPGLTGPTCSNVDCSDFPCFNGGTCVPGPPDMCICPPGYVQPFCTFSCWIAPCVNGTCVNDVCNCDTNFAGPRCESAIAAYLSPSEITVTVGHKVFTLQVCRQPSSEEVTLAVSTVPFSDIDFVDTPMYSRQDVTIYAGQPCAPVNFLIASDLNQEMMRKDFVLFLIDPQPSSSMVHIVTVNDATFITLTDDDPGCLMEPCQNGGTCNDDDLCSCQPGFVGPSCQSTIAVYLDPLEVSVTEGNVGDDISVQIYVCRQPSNLTTTVTVTTTQDSAMTSSDFAPISTPVTIPIGKLCVPVDISIVSDMIIEPTEVFYLVILPIPSVYIGEGIATITIIDNDDIDECSIGSHICDAMTSECMNTLGSYRCDCRTGYTGESNSPGQQPTCEDIDECSIGSHICDAMTSECMNTIGSYRCDCKTGYTGESYSPGQQPTCEESEPPSSPVYLVALVIPVLIIIILLVVIIKRKRRKEYQPVNVQDVDYVNAGVTDDPGEYIALEEQSRNTPAPKYQDLTENERTTQESRFERTIDETADAAPKAMPRQGMKSHTNYQYEDVNLGETDARKLPSVPQPDLQSEDDREFEVLKDV